MKKKISILGSTGSVGLSTLKIIDKKKAYFKINILAAKENYSLICKQIKKYQPKIFKNNNIDKKNLIIKKIDIRDKKKISNLFKKHKFDFCFHLAAISQVLTSNLSPNETFQINIFGTITSHFILI